MDLFPPSLQRPALLEFAQFLDSRPSAHRRDENGDWRINGRGGHIYAVPRGFQIVVVCEKPEMGLAGRWTARGWTAAKNALGAFARLVDKGDDEGVFILEHLPSPSQAAILRRYCMIPKRVAYSEEELARRRAAVADRFGGSGAKIPRMQILGWGGSLLTRFGRRGAFLSVFYRCSCAPRGDRPLAAPASCLRTTPKAEAEGQERPVMTSAGRFGPTHRSAWDRIDNPLVRVELRDQAGWWICRYPTSQDLVRNAPDEVVGPYETQAQAVRILNSAPLSRMASSSEVDAV